VRFWVIVNRAPSKPAAPENMVLVNWLTLLGTSRVLASSVQMNVNLRWTIGDGNLSDIHPLTAAHTLNSDATTYQPYVEPPLTFL